MESGVVEFAEKVNADSEGDIDSAVSKLVNKLVKGIRIDLFPQLQLLLPS